MPPRVQVKALRPDAVVPRYMSANAAGLDLYAAIDAPLILAPGARAAVGTGLALAIPDGHEGQVRPRSGLAREHGVTLVNAPGTIDADYRGELIVLLINLGTAPVAIEPGMRIAQLVIAPVVQAELVVVDTLSATERGSGGSGRRDATAEMAPREPPHPRADLDDEDPTVAREIPTAPARRAPAQTIQAISMKTPAALASGKQPRVPPEPRPVPQVQLRSIGGLQSHQNAAIGGRTGNLAPPRDPSEVRLRRARSNARWAVISLIVAACVATAYWLIAR